MLIKKTCLLTGIRIVTIALIFLCCKKSTTPDDGNNPPPGEDTATVKPVTDPPVAKTMGFFLDDWQSRTFTAPAYTDVAIPSAPPDDVVTVDASSIITKIPLSLFGHNANTWMTPMVTEPLFMNHITNLQPHIIRWPAGSGSDLYFWNKAPDEKPSDAPAQLMNSGGVLQDAGYWYGKTDYNWSASLDQYYQMRQQSGNEGIITVNYGYARYGTSNNPVAAAAHLAADWVRYDNGRTKYWEVGNENFGEWEAGYRIDLSKNKDGQPEYVTGKLYAQHFKVFVDSMQKAAADIGKTIYIGAVTYDAATEAWQTNTVKTWNSSMMPELGGKQDFYIVHNYFTPYQTNSTASDILGAAQLTPMTMMDFVSGQIQTYGAAEKPIALTEWNMFAVGSKQQVSNTSGVFALIVLGELLKNKFGMASRWDLLNGWSNGDDHGLFSDGGEAGIPKWNPRPSFYYMYFFKQFLGDRMVPATRPGVINLIPYASTFSSGEINVSLANRSAKAVTVKIETKNFRKGNRYYWYSLEGSNDNGEFSRKVSVNGSTTTLAAGGPADYTAIKAMSASAAGDIKVTVPALGAVYLVIDKK